MGGGGGGLERMDETFLELLGDLLPFDTVELLFGGDMPF